MAWDDKNYFWKCKDCKMLRSVEHRSVGYCSLYHGDVSKDSEICSNFETNDGKRPRFCKLAGSVEEMAKGIVFLHDVKRQKPMLSFCGSGNLYGSIPEAVEAAEKWLMEVEE